MKLFLYGDKASRQILAKKLMTSPALFFAKFGSTVWEYAYCKWVSSSVKREMINRIALPAIVKLKFPHVDESKSFMELYESFDTDTQKAVIANLERVFQRAVDKELLSRVPVQTMICYFTRLASEEQMTSWIERLSEGFMDLLSTKDGVEALVRLAGYATAKQRKKLVKGIKGRVIEIATNQADCVFLCRLLSTVDDTKLLSEILKEIVSDIKNLCSNKYGCKVIFMLLCGISKRFFTEYEFTLLNLPSITSQKQPEVRRTELVKELNLQVRNIEGVDMILANLQEKGLKQAQMPKNKI